MNLDDARIDVHLMTKADSPTWRILNLSEFQIGERTESRDKRFARSSRSKDQRDFNNTSIDLLRQVPQEE